MAKSTKHVENVDHDMKIHMIKQSAKVLNSREELASFGSIIESSARVCYASNDRMDSYSEDDFSTTFIRGIINRGHLSVLEHALVRVEFVLSRGILMELTRHRLASYSAESTRYCDYSKDISFILPPSMLSQYRIKSKAYNAYISSLVWSAYDYRALINLELPREQARDVLPNALASRVRMSMNLRELRHVLEMRGSSHAHPDIRALMGHLVSELIKNGLPSVFLEGEDIKESRDTLYEEYSELEEFELERL